MKFSNSFHKRSTIKDKPRELIPFSNSKIVDNLAFKNTMMKLGSLSNTRDSPPMFKKPNRNSLFAYICKSNNKQSPQNVRSSRKMKDIKIGAMKRSGGGFGSNEGSSSLIRPKYDVQPYQKVLTTAWIIGSATPLIQRPQSSRSTNRYKLIP